jgi:hypothetical protein
MSVLNGGSAGQLEYVLGKDGFDRDGEGEGNEEDYDATRSEAKQAHAERMANIGSQSSSSSSGSSGGGYAAAPSAEASPADEPKSRRQDAKASSDSSAQSDSKGGSSGGGVAGEAKGAESKGSSRPANAPQHKSDGFRLLGDLPSFGGKPSASDVKVAIALELPSEQQKGKNKGGSLAPSRGPSKPTDPDVPEKFVCAINGHVMKDPVRSSTGFYFERATIELWLSTRGSICPISNQPLTADDLEPATDLRNEIKRYHIQKTSMRTAAKHDDDLYDF